MREVHLDFETQSFADLKRVGAYVYANHPSTRIMCLCFRTNSASTLVTPPLNCQELKELAESNDVIFIAHNALFEQEIWRAIMVPLGYPDIPINRWRCTMAMAYAHGLPGSLDQAVRALKLPARKDTAGKKIMQKLSKPKPRIRPLEFWTPFELPSEFQVLYGYCAQDVLAECGLYHELQPLSSREQQVWFIDQRINREGLRIDWDSVQRAITIAGEQKKILYASFDEATGMQIGAPTRRAKVQEWLKTKGIVVPDTKKTTLDGLDLSGAPDNVRQAIGIMGEANKSSLAKYNAMTVRSVDHVLRGLYAYYGSHTGRWAGRGVQVHNLPRGVVCSDTFLDMLSYMDFDQLSTFYGDLNAALSSAIRGVIIPRPDYRFFCGDYKQIEFVTLAWMTGNAQILNLFRSGIDMYCRTASSFFMRTITKEDKHERQTGKTGELAYQYQGGIAAMAKFAEVYGVDLGALYRPLWLSATLAEQQTAREYYAMYLKRHKEDRVKTPPVNSDFGYAANILKDRWRKSRPDVTSYWEDINDAAVRAVIHPNSPVLQGRGVWFMHRQFLCRKLPSGRNMLYPYPKVEFTKSGKAKLTYRRVDPITKQWVRTSTYGGQLTENEDQAISRDVLADALIRLEDTYPACMHTHDEIMSEVRNGRGSLDDFSTIMSTQPGWAGTYQNGIPIKVDAWEGTRYKK